MDRRSLAAVFQSKGLSISFGRGLGNGVIVQVEDGHGRLNSTMSSNLDGSPPDILNFDEAVQMAGVAVGAYDYDSDFERLADRLASKLERLPIDRIQSFEIRIKPRDEGLEEIYARAVTDKIVKVYSYTQSTSYYRLRYMMRLDRVAMFIDNIIEQIAEQEA